MPPRLPTPMNLTLEIKREEKQIDLWQKSQTQNKSKTLWQIKQQGGINLVMIMKETYNSKLNVAPSRNYYP